jgi:septation ring formation regulator EzrA
MDKLKKFALMEKISHELEDLKNSQVAVLNKMAKIEIDNMELNNKKLEDKLPDMHQSAADMVDSIQEILSDFESIKSSYESKNNIDALKEQELVNSVK